MTDALSARSNALLRGTAWIEQPTSAPWEDRQ